MSPPSLCTDVVPNSGGETALPLAEALNERLQSIKGMSQCASNMGVSVVPNKVGVTRYTHA